MDILNIRQIILISLLIGVALADNVSLETYDRAIKIDPRDSDAFFNRGFEYFKMGSYEKAIRDFDRVEILEPENTLPVLYRGKSKIKINDMRGAIRDFSKVIEMNPKNSDAYLMRAQVRIRVNELDNALIDLDSLILLSPDHAKARAWKAKLENQLGKVEAALEDYKLSVTLDPMYSWAVNNLAWLYITCENEKIRDFKRGLELAEKAVQMDRKAEYLDTLACAYAENGNFDLAVKIIWEASVMNPSEDYKMKLQLFRNKKTYLQWYNEVKMNQYQQEFRKQMEKEKRDQLWQEIVSQNEATRRKPQTRD